MDKSELRALIAAARAVGEADALDHAIRAVMALNKYGNPFQAELTALVSALTQHDRTVRARAAQLLREAGAPRPVSADNPGAALDALLDVGPVKTPARGSKRNR